MEVTEEKNENNNHDKEEREKQNEQELKDIMDAGACLAIKSEKDTQFNEIVKKKSRY